MLEVAGGNEAVAAIISGATQDENAGKLGVGVMLDDRFGAAQPRELHELLQLEFRRAHKVLVELRSRVLRKKKIMSPLFFQKNTIALCRHLIY
jgi:hypothetical protein